MLIKEHQFSLHVPPSVMRFVVEELIWSERPWPNKFRLTVKSHNSQEKTLYGPTAKELVKSAIRYLCLQEVSPIRPVPSLRQIQTRLGANGD